MMKILKILSLGILSTTLFFISSCGSSRKFGKAPTEGDISVNDHIAANDIIGLIDDYFVYPDKQTSIYNYFGYEVNWDDYSYGLLLNCIKETESDSVLHSFFSSVKDDREENILEILSHSSFEDIGNYYVAHKDEGPFIIDCIQDIIIPELQDADYVLVRHLHNCFKDTELSNSIDSVWEYKRSVLLPSVEEALNAYYKNENVLEDYYLEKCFEDIKGYIDSTFPQLMEDCINEVENGIMDLLLVSIQTNDEPYDTRVAKIVEKYIPSSNIRQTIRSNVDNLVNDINNSRLSAAMAITLNDSVDYTQIKYPTNTINYVSPQIPREIPVAIDNMTSTLRKRRNAISLLSTAVSFIPGVGWVVKGVDIALTGADILYGISSSVKEKQEVDAFLNEFSETLYECEVNQVIQSCKTEFAKVIETINNTRNNYTDQIYEIF
jgi:hypothetical protein